MEKMRQWTLLALLGIVAILLGGYFLLVKPKSDEAAELRATAETQRGANRALQQDIARLNAQAKDLPRQQAKLAAFAQRIPSNPALPSLIRSLTDAADRAGVELVSLNPTAPAPVAAPAAAPVAGADAGTAGGQTAAGASATTEPLYQIALNLVIRGGYVQVQQFFSNLEDLTRTLEVSAFQAAPLTGDGSSTGATARTGDIATTISGRVFLVTSAPAPPATVPAGAVPTAAPPAQPTAQPTATPAP